jgi:hypothetical protein
MPFSVADLDRELRRDNPNFDRFLRSDLHALVAILRRTPATLTPNIVAAEMKKVTAEKWRKYAHTRRYLESVIPTLTALLRATPTEFTTVRMSSQMNDAILRHEFRWTSDTGSMQDLAQVFTRERVTWQQWPAALTNCIGPSHGEEYTRPGQHTGLANNPANIGKGQDDHALLGPFNETVLNYNGPAVRALMEQVYEYSHDRVDWLPIPHSTYSIVREVSAIAGGRVQIKITKTNATRPRDTFTVTKVF